jgi:hypothetical protein
VDISPAYDRKPYEALTVYRRYGEEFVEIGAAVFDPASGRIARNVPPEIEAAVSRLEAGWTRHQTLSDEALHKNGAEIDLAALDVAAEMSKRAPNWGRMHHDLTRQLGLS